MRSLPRRHGLATIVLLALIFSGVASLLSAHDQSNEISGIQHLESAADRRSRADYLFSRRGLGFGIPQGAYSAAIHHVDRMRRDAVPAANSPAWNFIGPRPILNEIPTFGGVALGAPLGSATGRVTAIAADPTASGRIFVGTAGGGLWMSPDSGSSFTQIFDSSGFAGSIGALALDATTTPPTIYAGSGEGDFSGDSYYGDGLFVSSDLGVSWTRQTAYQAFIDSSFSQLAINTSVSPRTLFAAISIGSSGSRAEATFVQSNIVNNGIWRSKDGGTTWSQIPLAPVDACPSFGGYCPGSGVVIDPKFPSNVYASLFQAGVFRSVDGGTTWSMVSFPNVQSDRIGRASIAARGGIVYAALGASDGIEYLGFFKSSDSGRSWTRMTTPVVAVGGVVIDGASPTNWSQSAFDQALAIDPSDPSAATVIFGGVGIYRSTDSGLHWTFLASAGAVHSDQHALAFDPSHPPRVFVGNDGGLYSYDTLLGTWTALSEGLPAAQLQSIGPHPSDSSTVLAGASGNGTLRMSVSPSPPGWSATDIFDGGFAVFDRLDPLRAYHTSATGKLGPVVAYSKNGGASWSSYAPTSNLRSAMQAAGDRGAAFYPPLASSPLYARRVLFGAHSVYVSGDGGATWLRQTTQDLTGGCQTGACALQDLEFAPSKPNVAYALSMQTFITAPPTPFKIFTTIQANVQVDATHPNGALWSDVTTNVPFSASRTQATGIAVSPFDSAVAYLSVSGFTAATAVGHLFVTTDGGGYWSQADGNPNNLVPPPPGALPDAPVLRALVDANDTTGRTVLVATDIGIFRSTDRGVSWSPFNLGIVPVVPVFDLEQNNNGVIFAATYGRGAYRLDSGATPSASATPSTTPTPIASTTKTATRTPTPTPTSTRTATRTATPTATPTGVLSHLTYTPRRAIFGRVAYGNTGAKSPPRFLTLTNQGSVEVLLSGTTMTGSAASDFNIASDRSTCGTQIAAHQKCRYSLSFSPTALGDRQANLVVQENGANGPLTIPLAGTGVQPAITIRPRVLTMGTAQITRAQAPKYFSIENHSPVAVTIVTITSTNDDFAPDAGCLGQLQAGASCIVNVAFTPSAAGTRTGYIEITDNARSSPQRVKVSGRGRAP